MHAQGIQELRLDSSAVITVVDVLYDGNKRTRVQIIQRELTFGVGDKLYLSNLNAAMEQSQNNLMNLGLFNFIDIELLTVGDNEVMMLILVQERWYIYPAPIFQIAETNFNTWWENKELRWLNYGVSVRHDNFRGLNQRFNVVARFGYTKRFSAAYSIPNLNKKQTLGISFGVGYFENNELVYNTLDNRRQFYFNADEKARRWMEYKLGLSYRENIFTKHNLTIALNTVRINDTVPLLNDNYLPGSGTEAQFLRVAYTLSHDTRDYKRYPLKGVLLHAHFQQDGLGFESDSQLNLFTTQLSYRHHHKLSDRWFVGHALTGKINWSEPPYYLVNALGYGNIVRGYEFDIIDGSHVALLQSHLKYQVLKPKTFAIPFIPSQFGDTFIALYANLFFDVGYVHGPLYADVNSLVNEYLYSAGIGLDLVTYYDKVMRVEGSINGQGRAAVFVHFTQSF
jgi:outer membrane protein assembly factor BamA